MVFDLDKLIAERQPKRRRKQFQFKFGGDTYSLQGELDTLALNALGGPHGNEGLRKLLGPEQYDRILASEAVMTDATLQELFSAYAKHLGGVELGESDASPRRSTRTARPSKRTSNGSTAKSSRR